MHTKIQTYLKPLLLTTVLFLFASACSGKTTTDFQLTGQLKIFIDSLPNELQVIELKSLEKTANSSTLFPKTEGNNSQLSLKLSMSSVVSTFEWENPSNKALKLRFSKIQCIDDAGQTIAPLDLHLFSSGIGRDKASRIWSQDAALDVEIQANSNRWVSYSTRNFADVLYACTGMQASKQQTGGKIGDELIGKRLRLMLPYDSDSQTGRLVFDLEIKNLGHRTSYF